MLKLTDRSSLPNRDRFSDFRVMSSLRYDQTIEPADEDVDGPAVVRPPSTATRATRVWRGVAAFLLGLTLGISGIVIGQSAFERHLDLFGPADAPPVLRR